MRASAPLARPAQSCMLLIRSRTTEEHSLKERSSAASDGNGSSIDKWPLSSLTSTMFSSMRVVTVHDNRSAPLNWAGMLSGSPVRVPWPQWLLAGKGSSSLFAGLHLLGRGS